MITEKIIRVRLLCHPTGLYMALSEDLDGLVVHGQSPEEIEERLPAIIRDLLEMSGARVHEVTLQRDEESNVPDFGPPAFIASASLAAAAIQQ